jgi:hypothetical protein
MGSHVGWLAPLVLSSTPSLPMTRRMGDGSGELPRPVARSGSSVLGDEVDRRAFLRLLGGAGVFGFALGGVQTPRRTAARDWKRWSDPETWGGSVPGRDDVAVVSDAMLLDKNVRVAGIVIEPRGNLSFHPQKSVRVESTGNVVVRGRLTMRPEAPRMVHRIVFVDVDEAGFLGGGMEPLPSDVGLWVMGNGILDLAGSRKLAWIRASRTVRAGSTTVHLQGDPVGWRIGDEVVLTPTLGPGSPDHSLAYDSATLTAINGRVVTLSEPTRFQHPVVSPGPGVTLGPEILNLTRNVRIEGTPEGRAHIFVRSARPQSIGNVAIRYMGPRHPDGEFTVETLGRYGLHFHHCGDGSRSSTVAGVVVRDCGSHAYVPHQSNGVTFRRCISHDTYEDAYWWDPEPEFTNDALFDHCVASLVRSDPDFRGYRLAGFQINARSGNVARGCVAVGIQGTSSAAGFVWPESSVGSWTFEDCVAHNNSVHGIFVWQNNGLQHPIERFVAYHNGGAGISHGAYMNGYQYSDSVLYANGLASVELHALSRADLQLSFVDVLMDQAGLTPYCVVTTEHALPGEIPVLIDRCLFRGYTEAALAFLADATSPELFEIRDCTFEGNEMWLSSEIHAASLISLRDALHGDTDVRRFDQAGSLRPEWNASVSA